METDVCAAIISYNDFDALEKTVHHILPQVKKVLIIDNKSDRITVKKINTLINLSKVDIIFNEKNYGIPQAYNQAINYCKENSYEYIFTLDQDSVVGMNCINELLHVYEQRDDVYIAVPTIIYNTSTGIDYSKNYIFEKKYAISSGNLINIDTYEKIGNYNEMLFIDSVDFDFSLRVINAGGKIYENKKTQMLHRLGELKYKNLLGLKVKYTYHNNMRNYYIYRNSIFIIREYFKTNFIFCVKRFIILSRDLIMNILFNIDRDGYLQSVFNGIKDGLKKKFGVLEEDV